MKNNEITNAIIQERFGKDSLIALATVDGDIPAVRTVNTVYIDGAFYVVTYALSGKMKQIAKNPTVAICGDWFTAHGVGENLGHVLLEENQNIMEKLPLSAPRAVFNAQRKKLRVKGRMITAPTTERISTTLSFH